MIDVGTLKEKIWEEVPSVMLYKEEINSILGMKEEIASDNVYVSREETLNLVKEFLGELSTDYLEFFRTIDLFLKDDDELCSLIMMNEEFSKRGFGLFFFGSNTNFDKDSKKPLIDLHVTNTIRDGFLLTHEFIHLVSGFNREDRVLDEVQSILGEFAFGEFLIRKGYPREKINEHWRRRVDDFIPRDKDFYTIMKVLDDNELEEITLKRDEIDCAIRLIRDNIKYLIGYYIACELVNSTDNINDLLIKLNYIKLRYGDLRYFDCVNDRMVDNDNKIKRKSKGNIY